MNDDLAEQTRRKIREAIAGGDATGWFEQVYAAAESGIGAVPWARFSPDPMLMRWLEHKQMHGSAKRALVVGCGLGDDAEAIVTLGFEVTAFDISETAIAGCKKRFPESSVHYQVADLFKVPTDQAFDFVFESRTIQSLPWHLCDPAIAAIAGQVAPKGTLLVLCMGREPQEDRRGIPWALSRTELAGFLTHGLVECSFEDYQEGGRRFCVEYSRETP